MGGEYLLLAKVGIIIGGIVKAGYIFAGGIMVRTGIRYFHDYQTSIALEKEENK